MRDRSLFIVTLAWVGITSGCDRASPSEGGSTTATTTATATVTDPIEAPEPTPAGKQPQPLSDAAIEAPIPTAAPPLDFWEQGSAACDPGGRLDGGLPPLDTVIRCVDEHGKWFGPNATFHPGEPARVHVIGRREDAKMVGVWRWFHASGVMSAERSYVAGELHGIAREFSETGSEREYGEYRAGRPWGLFLSRDAEGNELARTQLDRGTGRLVKVDVGGRTESDYVDGLLHGVHRNYDNRDELIRESHWSGGEQHGPEVQFDSEGRKSTEQSYVGDRLHGPATRWQAGVIVERSVWVDGDERSRQLFLDGEPLHPMPTATDCDTNEGIAKLLDLDDTRDGCIAREPLFPGVVMVGSFAHDRGCMGARWVVDGELAATAPTAAELLARAGWAKASANQRTQLAQAYLHELGLAWAGSITSDPEAPIWTVRDDGGIEAVVWIAEPSGMQIGRELDKIRFGFSPEGVLTRTELEHRSTTD